MKKYIILHLSLILLVFIACTDDQKQDEQKHKPSREVISKSENHYPEKLLNLTVLFYDLHKSNYSTPS